MRYLTICLILLNLHSIEAVDNHSDKQQQIMLVAVSDSLTNKWPDNWTAKLGQKSEEIVVIPKGRPGWSSARYMERIDQKRSGYRAFLRNLI